MKQFTIELDEVAYETLQHIMETRSNRTEQQVMEQIVQRGMYALDYRTLRNRKIYEAMKAAKQV
jgi:hypothetical protein